MRIHLEERMAVAAPPEAVFAAVADWESQSAPSASARSPAATAASNAKVAPRS